MNITKGHIIDKYQLNEVVGRGGTATVWSVVKLDNENLFDEKALKVFNSELISHKESIREIKKQFHRQKTINHPNILSPISIFEDEGVPAILFEKAEMSLQQLLLNKRSAGGFNENELVDIIGDVTSGLIHLHFEEDLAHNDVKTDNILVFKVGDGYSYKLCDLDTSIALRATIMLRLTTKLDRNDIYFTPLYVSPEKKQAVDNNKRTSYDPKKSDVFSLGATILELCTSLDIPVEQLIRQKKLEPIIKSLKVSNRFKDLLSKMLKKDPDFRLSIAEVNDIVNFRQNNGFWAELHKDKKRKLLPFLFLIIPIVLAWFGYNQYLNTQSQTMNIFENYKSHTKLINGFACVCENKCGVINDKGLLVKELQYSNCENLSTKIILEQDTFQIKNKKLLKLNR